jgi:AcrR family transcriptional regulator
VGIQARRNRERLLTAADELFSEQGADASMEDIARRAKVGIGTLYRHFSTREELLAATVEDGLLALAKKGRPLAESTSTANALAKFLEALVEHASTYRGLAASLGLVLQHDTPGCQEANDTGKRLLADAQATGEIRRNVEFADLVCMVTAIGLAAQENPSDRARVRRLVGMFVDGLRAPPPSRR